MRNDHYPPGTVRALLQTDFVLPQTKKVLQERLDAPIVTEPSFFSKEEFATLQAVCKYLLPQPPERGQLIDLAGIMDSQIKNGKASNGWRYDVMPPDKEAIKLGLRGIEETANILHQQPFSEIESFQQESILQAIQEKKAIGKIWEQIPSHLFFEELLAALVEIYYSHPVGKEEIGDVSAADAKGWQHIQLNGREPQEPEIIKSNNL